MDATTVNSDDYTLADFLQSDDGDPFTKARAFSGFLDDWKRKGTYSYHRVVASACSNTTTIRDPAHPEDRRMLVFASNNYLGLNHHPDVIAAAQAALAKYGSGMCGSRFLSGTYDLVVELERELADFEQREDAVVFTSGYQTNVGTISALMRPGDLVVLDRLSHASIVDGCRLAGCTFRTFAHNDMHDLNEVLTLHSSKYRGKLIIVEGVYSMDGDLAPLPDIIALARRHGARVMVDEAHGTGILGKNGRGATEHFGVERDVDIILGTFSKALSATGGYIAASRQLTDYVRHYGRSYMFSASPTPATVAGVLAALRILRSEPERRNRLWRNVKYVYNRLRSMGIPVFPDPPESAILSIPIGPDTVVRAMSKAVYEAGLFMSTVAYPAVPPNEGKLRLTLSACHTPDDLDEAVRVLAATYDAHPATEGIPT